MCTAMMSLTLHSKFTGEAATRGARDICGIDSFQPGCHKLINFGRRRGRVHLFGEFTGAKVPYELAAELGIAHRILARGA